MAIAYLVPASQGNYTQFVLFSGSTKPSAMAVDSVPGETRSLGLYSESYIHGGMPADAGVINSVAIESVNKTGADTGTYWFKNLMRESSTDWFGARRSTASNTSYVRQTDSAIASSPSGSAWTPAVIDATQIGIWREDSKTGSNCFHRFVQMTVDYEVKSGGFVLFVSQFIPPLLAVASHGLLVREAAAILSRRLVQPSTLEELRRILEAFRRRPAILYMGG